MSASVVYCKVKSSGGTYIVGVIQKHNKLQIQSLNEAQFQAGRKWEWNFLEDAEQLPAYMLNIATL